MGQVCIHGDGGLFQGIGGTLANALRWVHHEKGLRHERGQLPRKALQLPTPAQGPPARTQYRHEILGTEAFSEVPQQGSPPLDLCEREGVFGRYLPEDAIVKTGVSADRHDLQARVHFGSQALDQPCGSRKPRVPIGFGGEDQHHATRGVEGVSHAGHDDGLPCLFEELVEDGSKDRGSACRRAPIPPHHHDRGPCLGHGTNHPGGDVRVHPGQG